MDMVPGTVTYFWLTPTTAGTYEILCFELCGSGHYAMRGTVVVDEEADYQAWLQEQSTFAELYARAASGATESTELARSEERRLGEEGDSKCRAGWYAVP